MFVSRRLFVYYCVVFLRVIREDVFVVKKEYIITFGRDGRDGRDGRGSGKNALRKGMGWGGVEWVDGSGEGSKYQKICFPVSFSALIYAIRSFSL